MDQQSNLIVMPVGNSQHVTQLDIAVGHPIHELLESPSLAFLLDDGVTGTDDQHTSTHNHNTYK